MSASDYANGAVAIAAVLFAFGIVGRHGAVLALLFFTDWLNFVLSYLPAPPVALLYRATGIAIESSVIWSLGDAFIAIGGLVCFVHDRRAWWALAVYALSLTQVILHGLYWDVELIAKTTYYPTLNLMFWSKAAVFIVAGGGGIASRIGRLLDRSGDVRHTHPSAHSGAR